MHHSIFSFQLKSLKLNVWTRVFLPKLWGGLLHLTKEWKAKRKKKKKNECVQVVPALWLHFLSGRGSETLRFQVWSIGVRSKAASAEDFSLKLNKMFAKCGNLWRQFEICSRLQDHDWTGNSSLLKGWVDPGFTHDRPETCSPFGCSSGCLCKDVRESGPWIKTTVSVRNHTMSHKQEAEGTCTKLTDHLKMLVGAQCL